MRADSQLAGKIAVAQNFDSFDRAICQAGISKSRFVHASALIELVKGVKIHRNVIGRMAGIVEAAFGDTANQGHLAAFEADADRASRAGRLTFAAAAAGFAMPAGLALTEAFAAVFGARARF